MNHNYLNIALLLHLSSHALLALNSHSQYLENGSKRPLQSIVVWFNKTMPLCLFFLGYL